MNAKRLLSALLVAALLVAPAVLMPATSALAQEDATATIVDIAVDNNDFSTLVTALTEAGLADALVGDGPFTVFAPTNTAFEALPDGLLETLLADPSGDLTDILTYHVVPGQIMAADISDGLDAGTLEGSYVTFSIDGDTAMVNNATIGPADIEGSNGVIHVIDQVLLPPRIVEALADESSEMADEEMADEETAEPAATPEPEEEMMDEETAEPAATPEPEEEMMDEETAESAATPEPEEEMMDEEMAEDAMVMGPSVAAEDQDSDGTMVTIAEVNATQAGWLVIHLDEDGAPGAVIGQTAVPAGETANVIVFLEEAIEGETGLWAMLHIDAGEAGTYEFPGPDVPARADDAIVMDSFTASAPAMMEEDMAEEDMAEEDMAEEDMADGDMVDGDMAEDEPAPESLPTTGSGPTGAPLAVSAAALVLLVLTAGTWIARRRPV